MSVLERHTERLSLRERGKPAPVPGMNASQLTGEMSTGDCRLKDGRTLSQATAHRATSPKRHGVKPSSGKVADIYAGTTVPGKDDGTDYFQEWRENGGMIPLPKAKTKSQDRLHRLSVKWIAGERSQDLEAVLRSGVLAIINTDPDHGGQWRAALNAAGLIFNT